MSARSRRFLRGPDQEAEPAPAGNVVAFSAVEAAERTALVREVWGDAILAEPAKVRAILHAQDAIGEENATMVGAAINVGRALIDVRRQLNPQEFARGLRESRRAWGGWSKSNVTKLIAVAEFVDRHTFAPERLPQSYTTLYEFTVLPEPVLQQTIEIGLFRPDVRRSDIQAFKHRAELDAPPRPPGVSPYAAEIERLAQELTVIESRADRLRRRLLEARAGEEEWKRERRR